jgi:hypothetical protein
MKRFLLRAACAALVVCCAFSDVRACDGPLRRLFTGASQRQPARFVQRIRDVRAARAPVYSSVPVLLRQTGSVAVEPAAHFTDGTPAVRAVEKPVADHTRFLNPLSFTAPGTTCTDCHQQPAPTFRRGR